jgi:hypothetical protein
MEPTKLDGRNDSDELVAALGAQTQIVPSACTFSLARSDATGGESKDYYYH